MKKLIRPILFLISIVSIGTAMFLANNSKMADNCITANHSLLELIYQAEESAGGMPSPTVAFYLLDKMNQSDLDQKCDRGLSSISFVNSKDYFLSNEQVNGTRSIYEQYLLSPKNGGAISMRTNFESENGQQ